LIVDRATGTPTRRLDQWLWFSRLVKSRSLAGRLCAEGAISVNQIAARKPNHSIRTGDLVIVPHQKDRPDRRAVDLGDPAPFARRIEGVEEFGGDFRNQSLK